MLSEKELYDQGILWFKANQLDVAKKYWDKAAIRGNVSAMFCLGLYYLSDQYYDKEEAVSWFEKAAQLGHKNARYQLELIDENISERIRIANQYFSDNLLKNKSGNLGFTIKKFGDYEWIILSDETDKELLLSKDIIDIRPFHNINECVCWENCELRYWLNGEFFESFDEKCKVNIMEVTQQNRCNYQYNIDGGHVTLDKCFLLSYDELKKYMLKSIIVEQSDDLLELSDNHDMLISVVNLSEKVLLSLEKRTRLDYSMVNGQQMGWWLRTPGAQSNRAMRVNCNGAIRLHGREITGRLVGVRPAIWVKK